METIKIKPLLAEVKLMALSWKQPYAELMLSGKIETRTWPTNYRGWVLICASKQGYHTEQLRRISGVHQMVRMGQFLNVEAPKYEGMAIAIGRLMNCRPMKPEDEDACFVKYYEDLWCHVYNHVYPIQPFPWKGKQGWKEVSEEIKKSIVIL